MNNEAYKGYKKKNMRHSDKKQWIDVKNEDVLS